MGEGGDVSSLGADVVLAFPLAGDALTRFALGHLHSLATVVKLFIEQARTLGHVDTFIIRSQIESFDQD